MTTGLWGSSDPLMPDTGIAFGAGAIYYASGTYGTIQAIDFHDGTPLWANFPPNQVPGALQTPVYTKLGTAAGAVYVADDAGNLYSLNLSDGSVVWAVAVSGNAPNGLSNPVVAPNYSGAPSGGAPSAIYLTDSSSLYCVQNTGAPPNILYTSATAINPVGTPQFHPATGQMFILEGNLPMPDGTTAANMVTALGLSGGGATFNWSVTCDPAGPITPPTLYDRSIYVCDSKNQLHILSVMDGHTIATSAPMSGSIVNASAVTVVAQANGNAQILVFVSSTDNNLYCLDGVTGDLVWSGQPMGESSNQALTAPVIDHGLVYVGGANNFVYAFKCADGSGAAEYDTQDTIVGIGGISSSMSTSNGNVYVGLEHNGIVAINLLSVINAFQVECDLIQDFDVPTPGSGAPGVTPIPVFQCHVTLFNADQNGNLSFLPGETVQISASETVTITANSTQVWTIGPDTTANLVADGTGKLVITIPANPAGTSSPGNSPPSSCLSCPMLTLWGNFMTQDERIVVYPDQPLHDHLLTITGTELQNATPYAATATGTAVPALPGAFQGSSGLGLANNLASAINNTIGQTPPSTTLMTVSQYIAATRTNSSGVLYSATPPSGSVRQVTGCAIPFAILDLSNGGCTFTQVEQSDVTAYWNAVLNAVGEGTEENIFGDIGDFVDDVVNDVVQVVSYAVQSVENQVTIFVSAIAGAVQSAYKCVVTYVQDAVNIVAGLLKSIVSDIESVIEFLSVLFSWGDIVNSMNGIAGMISSGIGSLESDMATLAGSDFPTFFAAIQSGIAGAFGGSTTSSAGSSAVGAQNSDPSTAYTKGGGSSVACTSFGQKTSDHMSNSTTPSSFLALSLDSGNITSQMETFLQTCSTNLSQDFANLPTEFANAVSALAAALVSPSTFAGADLSAILAPIQIIAGDLVSFASSVASAFVTLLQEVADDLLAFLTTPLNIPVISDIFSWMTNGATFNLLNLFSLLIAIPVTIVYKAVNDDTPPFTTATLDAGYSPEVAQVVYTFAMVVYGALEGLNDVCANLDSMNPFIWPTILLNVAVVTSLRYTFAPGALFSPPDSTHNDVYYGLTFAPFVFAIYAATGGGASSAQPIADLCNAATTAAGFGLLVDSIYLAFHDGNTWFQPAGASLIGNIFGCVSPINKGFSVITTQTRAALDVFSDAISGLFNIANWESANGTT